MHRRRLPGSQAVLPLNAVGKTVDRFEKGAAMEENSFLELMSGVNKGQGDAASELFLRFSNRLVALARSRLNNRLRQKADPEDIAQSVFKSFFRHQDREHFKLEDWNGLWGLLVTMTLRKCNRRVEMFNAGRRDIRRETNPTPADDSDRCWEPAAMEPTPDECTTLAETMELIMNMLDERGRTIFSMRLQGYTAPEISLETGVTERTVHRTLKEIRSILERILSSERTS
jgi:RNA polymerase sigma-70 factor (ECF subfamily)